MKAEVTREISLPKIRRQPPVKGWIPIRTTQKVRVPGQGPRETAEVIEVECDAWRNAEGEIFLDEETSRALDDIKARHFGLLSPEEIKQLRSLLSENALEGITQKQLASLLQLGEKTPARWESGRERPSRSMNLLLQAVQEGRIDRAWLEEKLSGKKSGPKKTRVVKIWDLFQVSPPFGQERIKKDILKRFQSGQRMPFLESTLEDYRHGKVSSEQMSSLANLYLEFVTLSGKTRETFVQNLRNKTSTPANR